MATSRLSDHERFMNAIAFSDLDSINRLVAVAVRNHKGVREIVHRIELALEGKYNVKSFQVCPSSLGCMDVSNLISFAGETL